MGKRISEYSVETTPDNSDYCIIYDESAGATKRVPYQQHPTYTVSNLPTAGIAGRTAFATDGLKDGETAGNGTGVLVYDDGNNWISVDNSSAVSS